jgi:hypothetical protein
MAIWIALILLLMTFILKIKIKIKIEGFDPFLPDNRPTDYPDQTFSIDLILAEKYTQKLIDKTTSEEKKKYLTDFLNLLQFI